MVDRPLQHSPEDDLVKDQVFGGCVADLEQFGLSDDALRHFSGRHGGVDDDANAVAARPGVQVNPHTKIAWKKVEELNYKNSISSNH